MSTSKRAEEVMDQASKTKVECFNEIVALLQKVPLDHDREAVLRAVAALFRMDL